MLSYNKTAASHETEMYRVFNMGLGMMLACERSRVNDVLAQVPGALEVGNVV